ncbi:hypothetical protein VE03_07749 [Pseudogymnoascus sp. 23342-1-I1]|nr:hypothetical protein VE03_07749 [Pseudogymnoascus sp. 23342-1-I1]
MKLSSDGSLVSHSAGLGRCAVSGLCDPCHSNVKGVVKTLLDAGVGIGAFQTEGYRGQLEIALKPQPPIRAVDQLIVVHDTVKCFFARQGLMATMSPRPVKALQQSAGQHTHVSIIPPNMEGSFLAGCAPFSPIRKIKTGYWELRCMDATTNMYLALTAALSAGIIGCLNEEPLLWPDTGLTVEHFPTSGTSLPESIGASLEQLGKTYHEFQDFMDTHISSVVQLCLLRY